MEFRLNANLQKQQKFYSLPKRYKQIRRICLYRLGSE